DESYFQTLARRHSWSVENRSLTLSIFDAEGKPHVFYDDHLELLRRSGCFVARKVWPGARLLYETFPVKSPCGAVSRAPDPAELTNRFDAAAERRLYGRPGLYMQSRLPTHDIHQRKTARRYVVLQGFSDLFEAFEGWYARETGSTVHGRLFSPSGAEFADRQHVGPGCLSADRRPRDRNPCAFLTNLLWASRGDAQAIMFHAEDSGEVWKFIAADDNACISMITGAWIVSLALSGLSGAQLRQEAVRLHRLEKDQITRLRAHDTRAQFRLHSLADALNSPVAVLHQLLEDTSGTKGKGLMAMPKLAPTDAVPALLRQLNKTGAPMQLVGEGLDRVLESDGQHPGKTSAQTTA
ncbi:MAG: glycosyl transferase, partial [Pseudomonadota bacterium]